MNLFRTLSGAALFLSIGASMSSCLQAPDYPVEPHIEEKAITVFRRGGAFGARDSVEIALNFKDGDGDLGLSDADTTGAFAANGGRNRFINNYFIDVFYRDNVTKEFVPLAQAFGYNGRFIRLTDRNARPGPIEGVLRYSIPFSLIAPETRPGTELRFKVSIADRALHESNVITTKSVIL